MKTPYVHRLHSAVAAALLALAVTACDNPNEPLPLGDSGAQQPTVVANPLVGLWSHNDGSRLSYWEFEEAGGATNYEELLSTGERVSWVHYGGWEIEEQAGEDDILFNVLIEGYDGVLEYDSENEVLLSGGGSGFKRTPMF